MILDSVASASLYRGTNPAVDRALVLLGTVPWLELEDGRHELAEGVYAILSSYETERPEIGRYEAHRRHADIQLLLKGRETIYRVSETDLDPDGEYDPEDDVLYFREPRPGDRAAAALQVMPGLFVLLYPADAHKPGRMWETSQPVRKAVLKIRL